LSGKAGDKFDDLVRPSNVGAESYWLHNLAAGLKWQYILAAAFLVTKVFPGLLLHTIWLPESDFKLKIHKKLFGSRAIPDRLGSVIHRAKMRDRGRGQEERRKEKSSSLVVLNIRGKGRKPLTCR